MLMKAIVYHEYGPADVLQCEEIEPPTAGDDEVLIRVRAASINPLDWRLMQGGPPIVRMLLGLGKSKPMQVGRDVAGQIEAIGKNVTQFKLGDAVFGTCRGAVAEYVCTPASAVVSKSDRVTFEQAASVPVAGLTALQGLRDKGKIRPGHKVLINGAAGGVGTFAVQLAKYFDAEVTGVCSTRNMEMVYSLGADQVIDYTKEDFTRKDERYDLILDCVGNHSPFACRRALKPKGICAIAGAAKKLRTILKHLLQAPVLSWFVSQKLVVFIARRSKDDLTFLHDLIVDGKLTPVIDRRYPLQDTAAAIRYLEAGHARGKVIIVVDQAGG